MRTARAGLPQQRLDVEPQSGEERAAQDARRVHLLPHVAPFAQHEPVHFTVVDTVHDVLLHPVAAVHVEFLVQVVADRTRRHLTHEFGRADHIPFRVDA